jgi:guanylate kinase
MKGKAVIVSAPSGAGKTTLVRHLLAAFPRLEFSVSATSRQKRENETEGKDYYFLTAEQFREKAESDEFVEWQEVYPGSCYGTLKKELQRIWDKDAVPLFDVDVFGGMNLKKYFGNSGLSLFVQPPSRAILEQRLRNRNSDSEESLQKRIGKAEYELSFAGQFDAVIVNDLLEKAVADASERVRQFLESTSGK